MPALSFNIDHLRRLNLLVPHNIHENEVLGAHLRAILLFCKILELNVEIYKCSNTPTLVLLRRDMKRGNIIKLYGPMAILRFLHASEHSPYSLYPLYPIERARVDGTIDLFTGKPLGQIQDYINSELLSIQPYLTITAPIRNLIDVQLRGSDPEPTVADIIGYYFVKLEQQNNQERYAKVESWLQSIENEWEEHMIEVKNEIEKVALEQAKEIDELMDVVRNKVYLIAKM